MAQKTEEHEDTRMPLTSADVLGERIEQLRELIPEAFVEGEVDFDRLRQALGDFVGEGRERYGLSWAGKADAIRAIQAPSVGTLAPCPEESINFDTTENVFIEGDNLEVLKLLQKGYYGKVKVIYIDPPYNTGSEFIYPDNYQEGLEEYLRYSGQVGDGGVRLSTNAETSGRYHSKWLDMIYPRLFLARNLLRQDGSIFVSIDDHEVHNLRLLLNEVFGEENFVTTIAWQRRDTPSNDSKTISTTHEYLLVYRRSEAFQRELLPRTKEQESEYKNPDDDPRGPWIRSTLIRKEFRKERVYSVKNAAGRERKPPPGTSWRVPPETFAALEADNRIWWGKDGDGDLAFAKRFLSEVKQGVVPVTWWDYRFAGSNRNAKVELRELFDHDVPFDTPKPVSLVRRILQVATTGEPGEVVLDFFAGSCTTAHAVFLQNAEDGGRREAVMVQLPENVALEKGQTIADIAKERLRRAIRKIKREAEGTLEFDDTRRKLDLGFRVFKLTSSNFKIWDATEAAAEPDQLSKQLKLFADHVLSDRSEQDILYELMLKAGLPLTAPIEEKTVAGQTVYSIAEGMLFICLAAEITQECLRGMMELEPQRVVCLDPAFKGNDQLKTNTVLEMKSHGIEFRTV